MLIAKGTVFCYLHGNYILIEQKYLQLQYVISKDPKKKGKT